MPGSLTSVLSEVSHLLDPNQFAYLVERGVEDALPTMINDIYENLEQAQIIVKIVFVDWTLSNPI